MEIRTLASFVAVVDAGTVSAAAERVRVTQPALSRQLRQLERELGVDLFERVAGRLVLSAAGRSLLPLARDVLASAETLRTAARVQAEGGLDRVTIAAPATTLADVVSPFLASLRDDDPTPSVVETAALDVDDAMRRGADLVVTTRRPRRPLRSAALPELPVWAYVRADHAWADRGSVGRSGGADLAVRLFVAWSSTHPAEASLAALAERLRTFVVAAYPDETGATGVTPAR